MSQQDLIVVGVDGTHAGETALRYAAREADRRGLGVRLVHVTPDLTHLVGSYAMALQVAPDDTQEMGRRIVESAAELARDLLGPDRVTVAVMTGNRVASLVDAAEGAALTVLGDEPRPALDRLVTGSVLTGVAARSTGPVVAVPDDWSPETEHGTVVVAIKDVDGSGGLVRLGLEAAAARGARLVVLHAWRLPVAYDDLIASRLDTEMWGGEISRLLERVVDEQRAAGPQVEVDVRVGHGQPAQLLVEASREADLILIARRARWFPIGHLGGTGRTVLRASLCPVEVQPPPKDEGPAAPGTSAVQQTTASA